MNDLRESFESWFLRFGDYPEGASTLAEFSGYEKTDINMLEELVRVVFAEGYRVATEDVATELSKLASRLVDERRLY